MYHHWNLLIAGVALVACSCDRGIRVPTHADVVSFTNSAHLTLPSGTDATAYRSESGGMDSAAWMQVTMRKELVDVFLASSPFGGAEIRTNGNSVVHLFGGFIKATPLAYREASSSLPNSDVLKLVIDDDDSTNAVIYIMWHEI